MKPQLTISDLARLGGQAKSEAKRIAARVNGKKGGRPVSVHTARQMGFDSVAAKPFVAPKNPFDEDKLPKQHEAWEDGAIEAGICSMYTNGVLSV